MSAAAKQGAAYAILGVLSWSINIPRGHMNIMCSQMLLHGGRGWGFLN